MKRSFLKPLTFRLLLFCSFLFATFIVNSCRKEHDQTKQTQGQIALVNNGINIAMLQNAYNKGTSNNNGKLKVNDVSQQTFANIINSLNVDWTSYTLFSYPDSTQVIEFTMPDDTSLLVPSQATLNDSSKYQSKTTAVFILNKDTISMSFFMKTIENESSAGYQSVINQLHYKQVPNTFTGNVLYFTLDRQYLNGYAWSNGAISKAVSLGTASTQQQTQVNRVSKLKTDVLQLTNCSSTVYGIYNVTVDQQGNILSWQNRIGTITVTTCDIVDDGTSVTTTTSGGGASGDTKTPNPLPCTPAASPPAVQSIKGRLVIDVASGGSGSSGGTAASPCPTVPPPPPDPCSQIAAVNAMAQSAARTALNQQLYKDTYTGHEYGDEENLSTWPANGTYINTPIRTDVQDKNFTPNFTWNSTNGYTMNMTHDHPAGDAPSPRDVFQLIISMNNSDFKRAGPAALSYYEQNASITVVTTNGTYVVMGADYSALSTLADDYNKDNAAFNANYESIGNANGFSSEYALLDVFGNSITVFKANPNTNTFSIITIDKKSGNVTIVKCPTN